MKIKIAALVAVAASLGYASLASAQIKSPALEDTKASSLSSISSSDLTSCNSAICFDDPAEALGGSALRLKKTDSGVQVLNIDLGAHGSQTPQNLEQCIDHCLEGAVAAKDHCSDNGGSSGTCQKAEEIYFEQCFIQLDCSSFPATGATFGGPN